jgi:hypothetical protein
MSLTPKTTMSRMATAEAELREEARAARGSVNGGPAYYTGES